MVVKVDFGGGSLHSYSMRLFLFTIMIVFGLSTAQATDYKYAVGGGGGLVKLSGGDFLSFDPEPAFGFSLGHRLTDRWQFDIDYSWFKFTNDVELDSTGSIGEISNNSPLEFKATRLGATFSRYLLASDNVVNLTAGLGGGLLIWKAVDPESGTTFEVLGANNEPADFSATELFVSATAGLSLRPSSRLSLGLTGRADYLTGAGADLQEELSSNRDRLVLGAQARLYVHFGSTEEEPVEWRSDPTWAAPRADRTIRPRADRDGDSDGIPDSQDRCLHTPRGAVVDNNGCPVDSDHDGVADGLDDCPATDAAAIGRVDVHGCAVDSDFDGVQDYLDRCPFNAVGALVDDYGCPIDSDGDGVANGLDDCPYTMVGVEVDKYGCIDLAMFSQPMVLNIDYAPGSFEIDPRTKDRIRRLAGLLNFVTDIRMEINGYTDDIGTPVANRNLSEKRANRVRDFLVTQNVDTGRMKVFGRGETNFVASNRTAEGRAKNRRIEIVFFK
ncbi:MAG: OmpA family protein [bacterium]|nr:OmpA family protein [bacterium]